MPAFPKEFESRAPPAASDGVWGFVTRHKVWIIIAIVVVVAGILAWRFMKSRSKGVPEAEDGVRDVVHDELLKIQSDLYNREAEDANAAKPPAPEAPPTPPQQVHTPQQPHAPARAPPPPTPSAATAPAAPQISPLYQRAPSQPPAPPTAQPPAQPPAQPTPAVASSSNSFSDSAPVTAERTPL